VAQREHYLGIIDEATRSRIELVHRSGDNPSGDGPVELVFIDGSHERDDTIQTFLAWVNRLVPGGAIAFHDYADPAWPGVSEAIRQLGLRGDVHGHLFVWTQGADHRDLRLS
jgi:hypothetical protein